MRLSLALLALAAAASVAAQGSVSSSTGLTRSESDSFSAIDTNQDGAIDRAEFAALEKHDKSGWISTLAGTAKAKLKAAAGGFVNAFWSSLSMIIATEIGDRTFCIAAIMSMRYARLTVFAGAIGALAVMTLLSASIGVILPNLLPRVYTHYAAGALFAFFGVKLLHEASSMAGGGVAEELAETEQELGITVEKPGPGEGGASPSLAGGSSSGSGGGAEGGMGSGAGATGSEVGASAPFLPASAGSSSGLGGGVSAGSDDPEPKSELAKVRARAAASANASGSGASGSSSSSSFSSATGSGGTMSTLLAEWPIFSQAFTLTFLAEWGDRSQIATIAMAAAQDPYGVCLGGVIGHSLCTGLAVLGGRLLASRISEKAVAVGGGVLFLLFGIHAFVVGPGAETE